MLGKLLYNLTLQCLVWEGQPMEITTNPSTKNLTPLTTITLRQLQWNWIMLGLRKEITKDIINNDNLKEIVASVENLGTGKMNVYKGIQVIITTRVTTIITIKGTTTITKIKGNLTIWRTPLLLPSLPFLLLLYLPITTIIWSLPMLKECRNNYSGLKVKSMDTLLGSCWTLVRLATSWMKNLWKNVNFQHRNHHLQQLNWLMDGNRKLLTL